MQTNQSACTCKKDTLFYLHPFKYQLNPFLTFFILRKISSLAFSAGRPLKFYSLLMVFFVAGVTNAFSTTITTAGSGNWSSTTPNAPWPGGTIPLATDDIIVGNGFTLTVDGNRTCNSVSFTAPTSGTGTGTLTVNSGFQLTVTTVVSFPAAGVSVKVSGTYNIAGLGTINAASLDCGTSTTPSGSAVSLITAISTISTLNISSNLILNSTFGSGSKANNSTFNLQSGNVTVNGSVVSVNANAGNVATVDIVTSASGPTLTLAGATPFSLSATGTNTINLNGAGATVNYSGAAQTVYGVNYTNLTLSGSGTKTLQALTTIIGGNFSLSGTAISTGVVGLSVGGNVVLGSGTAFTSGTFTHTVSGNWTNNGGTFTPGSGTVNFTSTTAAQAINGTAATQTFNNITITKTAQTLSVGGSTTSLNIGGTQTIATGTFDAGTAANIYLTGSGGNWTNNGGTFTPGSGTVIFNNTSGAQAINGTVVSRTFNNITVDKSGQTLSIGGSITAVALNGNLNLTAGTLADGGSIITVAGNITGTATHSGTGKISMTGSSKTISGVTLGNLELNNTSGFSLSGSPTINGTLTLTNGLLTTTTNTVTIASTGTITGASSARYVDGKLARVITTTTLTSFPVGKGAGTYRPVEFTYTAAPGTKTVTIEQFESGSPLSISTANTVRFGGRYWNINQSATGINYTIGLNNGGLTPTGSAVILRREGSGSTTQNATTFSSPTYSNSSAFSTTNVANDVALAETTIPLTVTGAAAANKVYDKTNAATISGTLSGVVSGDAVTLIGTGTFAQVNIGAGIVVTSTSTLSGTNAGSYTLTQPTGLTANITARALTVTGAANSKTYDGTTSSATVPTITSGALQGSDVAAFTETYDTKNVGTSKVMTPSGVVTDGNSGNNYTYTFVISSNGTITALSESTADFRSRITGNFSIPSTWEYDQGGSNWAIASQSPLSTNNVNIVSGHIITLDQNFTEGNGKTLLINSGGITINENFTLGVAAGGILNFNGQPVIIKSTASGTGAIGTIAGMLSGATNVTAERYIANKRSWRLLSIPVTGQTIRDAWAGAVANSNAPTGETANNIGTLITGPGYATGSAAATLGFDWFTGLNSSTTSSIRFYNTASKWASATNTPDPLSVPNKQGYMLYVRGDRTVANATNFGSTTLRPAGLLNQGQKTIAVAEAYTVVGNPYAAPIDLDLMYSNSGNSNIIKRNFWIWDATMGTTGGYRTLSWNGISYTMTGGSGTAADYLTVNSGQAFFVEQNTTGNIHIEESNKTTATPAAIFRPMGISDVSNLDIKLYQATGNTLNLKADGVVARYNDIYSVSPNETYDAAKLNNFNENLSLVRDNRYLSIESRPYPTQNDTLFVPFWGLKKRDYALTVTSSRLNGLNQTASMFDAFTNTSKQIDLNDTTTTYPFTVTSDPASSSLNRFTIVMGPSVVLPVTFTTIKAKLYGSKIAVNWSTASETGIKNYDVEKSADGIGFSKINSVAAMNAATGASYRWVDEQLFKGNNFYRIRSNDESGKITYSSIVMVQLNGKKGIQVSPTVITDQRFTVSLNGLVAGNYSLLLSNSSGQQVYQKIISNTSGNNAQVIELQKTAAITGIYNLSVTGADGTKQNFRLLIKN